MKLHILLRGFAVVLLLLLQIWFFNYIYLFRVATPFVYLFALMMLPIKSSQTICTLGGAGIGCLVDCFSGTPGIHMAATTLAGFVRPYFLRPLIDADTMQTEAPSFHEQGRGLAVILFLWVLLHHFVLFFLDAFLNFDLIYLVLRLISSAFFSFAFLIVLQMFFLEYSAKKER